MLLNYRLWYEKVRNVVDVKIPNLAHFSKLPVLGVKNDLIVTVPGADGERGEEETALTPLFWQHSLTISCTVPKIRNKYSQK